MLIVKSFGDKFLSDYSNIVLAFSTAMAQRCTSIYWVLYYTGTNLTRFYME